MRAFEIQRVNSRSSCKGGNMWEVFPLARFNKQQLRRYIYSQLVAREEEAEEVLQLREKLESWLQLKTQGSR